MKFTKEYSLFNNDISIPFVYIFASSPYHKLFVITEFASKNPVRVISVQTSLDMNQAFNIGREYTKSKGIMFLDNEIFVAIL